MFEGWPGEQLLMKLWDTVHKGGAGLLSPWQIKREASARTAAMREELLLAEQTRLDIENIRAGKSRFDGAGRVIPVSMQIEHQGHEADEAQVAISGPRVDVDLATTETLNRLERATNTTKAIIYARQEAETLEEKAVDAEPVDPDWFIRWRNNAGDVTNDQMQRLWGRVLARETQQSASFSLHALDLLSKLSRQDAELIERLARFRIGSYIFKAPQEYFDSEGITLGDLIHLDGLNIVRRTEEVGGVVKQISFQAVKGKRSAFLELGDRGILFTAAQSNNMPRLDMPIIPITKAAAQIMTLASVEIPTSYLQQLANWAKTSGCSEVQIATIVGRQGDIVQVSNERTAL